MNPVVKRFVEIMTEDVNKWEKAARDASYLTPVTFEQLFERRFVARTRRSDQRVICPFCE